MCYSVCPSTDIAKELRTHLTVLVYKRIPFDAKKITSQLTTDVRQCDKINYIVASLIGE